MAKKEPTEQEKFNARVRLAIKESKKTGMSIGELCTALQAEKKDVARALAALRKQELVRLSGEKRNARYFP